MKNTVTNLRVLFNSHAIGWEMDSRSLIGEQRRQDALLGRRARAADGRPSASRVDDGSRVWLQNDETKQAGETGGQTEIYRNRSRSQLGIGFSGAETSDSKPV